MLDRAVDAQDRLFADHEGRLHDRAFLARPTRAVMRDLQNLRAVEQRDIEIQRLLGAAFEHQERADGRHLEIPYGTSTANSSGVVMTDSSVEATTSPATSSGA